VIFFRLDRSARIALVGAALAAGPGCYLSHADPGDGGEDGGTDRGDGRDSREAEDAAEPPDEYEWPDMVVDCVPSPMCSEVASSALETSTAESTETYAVGTVHITLSEWEDVFCSGGTCLTITPEGGAGTVGDVVPLTTTTYRFRYDNPSLGWDTLVRLDLAWRVMCWNETWGYEERTVAGAAWACRDYASRIIITSDPGECSTVVDEAPGSMLLRRAPRLASAGGFRLLSRPAGHGSVRLRAAGPDARDVSYRWLASGGSLRMISDAEALFDPSADAGTWMVQVAAFTPDGVSVQVFRRNRT
jgi:hypothetical protein